MLLNEQRATQESRSPVAAEPSPARVWLGSEYLTTRTNAYRWMDGTAFDFAHWAPQHPTCADTDHLCALSMPIEGRWTYIAVTNYHSNYPHATASTNDASHSHNTTALATEVDASPSSGDSSLSSLLLNTSSIESTQLVMNEVSDRRSKGMPVLSSQICQRSIDRTVTNRPTIRSAERERSERQKQYRQVSERVERGLANLQSAIDLLRLSAVSTNQSIRRETGHRIREHERLRLLLGNQTQNVGNSLAKISAEQRQLSTQLRALAIVCAALIGALAVAAICACRSYLRLRRTYIHPHAVGALLDLNSQLSVAAAAAVNK